MNILNTFFDKIYCINLDRRSDRWNECVEKFNLMDIDVERFSACDGQLIDTGYGKVYNGELGGTISHTRLIKKIIDHGYERVLVLEDDVEFNHNFLTKTEEVIRELPSDWDILFFGGNHTGGFDTINSNLIKVYQTYALQCYALNKKCLSTIYDNMIRFIGHTLTCNKQLSPSVAADFYMAKMHKFINAYSVYPNITWQRESFSDLQQSITFYDFLKNES
jgi:GR25 family glycosyltransferase involved in LPS biosynthesis